MQLTYNQSRTYTNIGTTATPDRKAAGSALNSTFGGVSKAWGSSKIWAGGNLTNGVTSRATTRDNSASRDKLDHAAATEAETIEGKTGSGSLIDSSVSDPWSYGSAWSSRQSLPTARSTSQAKYADATFAQQRNISNVGLAQSPSTTQKPAPFVSRPATINLNATSGAQSRTRYGSTTSARVPAHGSEQPPNVYTKFDRPLEPNGRKPPDSAKGGLKYDNNMPPIERNGSLSTPFGSRAVSQPVSRDCSVPSRSGDDQQFFIRPDYTRASQVITHNGSRAPSTSSQGNSMYNSFSTLNPDQLVMQLSGLSMNGDSYSPTSYKPSSSSTTFPNPRPGTFKKAPSLHLTSNGTGLPFDLPEEMEQSSSTAPNYVGIHGYGSPQQSTGISDWIASGYGQFAQIPASGFRQGHSPSDSRNQAHYETPTGPRLNGEWQLAAHGTATPTRRTPTLQEQPAYLDPRVQQVLDAQMRGYAPLFHPYAMQNAVQLGAGTPYMPLVPMGLSNTDGAGGARDNTAADCMQSALLYDFKANTKARRYDLKDIYNHIAEFSGDQHGSRFIQTKLETANSDEKDRVFREIEPNAIPLMTDVFGNYVIQKFFEHGDQTHKKILASKMKGQVLNLSLQMYGCRVVQKALDHVLVDQQAQLISELETHVLQCVKDQNGNHVIQKAIERCPTNSIGFIIGAFQGQVQHLSIHPYGCRVIQRCLERCDSPSKSMIMAELMDGIQSMISDQYGNYVVQHIVEHDEGEGRRRVLQIVGRGLEAYSKHKFASNVVEKCLEKAADGWRREVMYVLANGNHHRGEGESVMVSLIKDNFGNYVIRKCSLVLVVATVKLMVYGQRNSWTRCVRKTIFTSSSIFSQR